MADIREFIVAAPPKVIENAQGFSRKDAAYRQFPDVTIFNLITTHDTSLYQAVHKDNTTFLISVKEKNNHID